jgi:hypothetical protein
VIPFYAEESSDYLMGIDAPSGTAKFTFLIDRTIANDERENSTPLETGMLTTTTSFIATWSVAEPRFGEFGLLPVGWWKWIAPESGPFELYVSSNSPTNAAAVYELDGANPIQSKVQLSAEAFSIYFQAEKGKEYLFAVANGGPSQSRFLVGVFPGEKHDRIEDPVVLSGGQARHISIYRGTLTNQGEPIAEWINKNTFWYRWTVPDDADYTMTAIQTNGHPQIVILAEYEPGHREIDSTALDGSTHFVSTKVSRSGGMDFLIGVATDRLEHEAVLTVQIDPSPVNDSMWKPLALTGSMMRVEGSTIGATRDIFDPPGTASLWYEWKAEKNQRMAMASDRSVVGRPFILGANNELIPVVIEEDFTFDATVGMRYLIRIISATKPGPFVFILSEIPSNYTIVQATELTGAELEIRSWTLGVPRRGEDSAPELWWKWKAPADRMVTLAASVGESNMAGLIRVFLPSKVTLETNVMGTVEGVPLKADTNLLRFMATSNVLYHIGVRTVLSSNRFGTSRSTNLVINLSHKASARPELLQDNFHNDWLFGGERPWQTSPGVVYEGEPAVESLLEAGVRQNWIEATFYGSGTLQFAWKKDGGVLSVRSTLFPQLYRSGTNEWKMEKLEFTEMVTKLRWAHTHDPKNPTARAWIAGLRFTPDPTLPLVFDISGARADTNGYFIARFFTQPRTSYIVLSSTNLLDWEPFWNVPTPTFSSSYIYAPVNEESQRFFRILSK